MSDDKPITGGCECGRIKYTASRSGSSSYSTRCYCKQCQRISGGPFMAFVDFTMPQISWSEQPDVFKSSDFAERYYCKECGSSIGMRYLYHPNSLGVTLGTLDQECDFVPETEKHIFLESKPHWYQVPDDGAQRFQSFDDDGSFEKEKQQWRDSLGTSKAN